MKRTKIMWGLVCLAVAALIILTATGVLSFSIFSGITTAKLVWTIIVGFFFIGSLISLSFEGIVITGGILLKMYESVLGFEISIPILIIVMILLIIAYNLLVPERIRHHKNSCGPHKHYHHGEEHWETSVSEEDGERIYVKNSFNGMTKYINSKNFKEAVVDNSFGGFEIYFNNAEVPDGKAVLEMNSRFGGVEIYIPRNWKVLNNMRSQMGGVEEQPMVLAEGEVPPVELNLCGSCAFSGIEIIRL